MSDTAANQKRYPQHSNQTVGCGFPLAKLVVWFCVSTGAVLEVSMAAFTTSEWELARQLYALLQPDDVVVADSAYGTYVDLALVRSAKADALRVAQSPTEGDPPTLRERLRRTGLDSPCFGNIMPADVIFAPGKKLGIGDHIVRWQRPKCGPKSMNPTDFAALPASIEVREVHLLIQTPGFRPLAQNCVNLGSPLTTTIHHGDRSSKTGLPRFTEIYRTPKKSFWSPPCSTLSVTPKPA